MRSSYNILQHCHVNLQHYMHHLIYTYTPSTLILYIVQLCVGGKYWRIGLSPRIGGEIFGELKFTS